jgi:tRNA 2-thiocytidine biosynthesis protein TtcA
MFVSVASFSTTVNGISTRAKHLLMTSNTSNNDQLSPEVEKIQSRLLKSLRHVSLRYSMLEPNDRIMVCVSGGKDSATLLHLLMQMQNRLASIGTPFDLVAVHLNQMQPGYDGRPLIDWLDKLGVEYKIVTEDTYSIVTDKTPENKAYCSLCSRLRRGILYSIAHELGCNKIALGHHGDDAMQTLLLNMIHGGSMKAMPARYFSSSRNVHILRPLITCTESDIAEFAKQMKFPILPCNLCGSQDDLHRGKAKLLVDAMESMNPNARRNVIKSLGNVRPSHLLDENLRDACGLDRVTGSVLDEDRARLIGEAKYDAMSSDEVIDREEQIGGLEIHNPTSFIESLL